MGQRDPAFLNWHRTTSRREIGSVQISYCVLHHEYMALNSSIRAYHAGQFAWRWNEPKRGNA